MKRPLRLALYLLSLLLFGLILWWGGPDAWRQVLAGDRDALLVAFLFYGVAGMVSALRLQVMAEAIAGRRLATWRRFYHLNMMARALGLVLPRSLSALGGKSVALRAFGLSLQRAIWTVMVDNLLDVLLLALLTVPALLFLQKRVATTVFMALMLMMILGLAVILWGGLATNRVAFVLQWGQRLPWLSRKLKVEGQSAVNLLPSPLHSVTALFLTVTLHASVALSFYEIGRAVGLSAAWLFFLAAFFITQLSLVIAIAPGGLGIFDLGWLGLLHLSGVPETEAFAFVIAQRAYTFVFVLIWAGVSTLLSLTTEKEPLLPNSSQ